MTVDFPPAQKGASFNLDAVKAQIETAMRNRGQLADAIANVPNAALFIALNGQRGKMEPL